MIPHRDEETRLRDLAERLRSWIREPPDAVLVLGSGLATVVDALEERSTLQAADLPHYPRPRVAGHDPRIHAGRLGGRPFLVLAGRVHLYEGHDVLTVVRPVRAAARLSPRIVILTNAAGALRPSCPPGRWMLTIDTLHLLGSRLGPLARVGARGARERIDAVMEAGVELAERSARRAGVPLRRGTLATALGPSYETAAEIRLLRRAGADAVTMSTVPERLALLREAVPVLTFTALTNWATGAGAVLSHEEVTVRARELARDLTRLLETLAPELPHLPPPTGPRRAVATVRPRPRPPKRDS